MRKKVFSVFAIVLVTTLCFFAVACSNETTESDIVDVSFQIPTSRDITSATTALVSTEDNPIVWHYSAQPVNENTKFAHGATLDGTTDANGDEFKVDENFKSSTISLSQGLWNFVLWAVQGSTTVYKGSVDNVLITRQETPVSIVIEISSVIDGVDGTISFADDIVIETSDDATVTEKINRITIGDIDYTYPAETSGKKFTLSAGTHTIYFSYVETFNVDGENKEVFYSKTPYDVTVQSGRNTVISGSIKEETASAEFNGTVNTTEVSAPEVTVVYDTTNGNVYDKTTSSYLTLDKDSLEFTTAPNVGDDLVLLDCSLSNSIPDDMINDYYKTDAYNWVSVQHTENCDDVTTNAETNSLYAGGYGTKIEPYLISSIEMWDNAHLNRDTYAYYKWKTKNDNIDCTYFFSYTNIHGSFDGNGSTFDNINFYLIGDIKQDDNGKTTIIKNFDVVASYVDAWDNSGLIGRILNPTLIKNVNISGDIISPYLNSSFVVSICANTTIENCSSNATLINIYPTAYYDHSVLTSKNAITGFAGIFNSALNNASVILKNSKFTGIMDQMKESDSTIKFEYKYATTYLSSGSTVKEDPENTYLNKLYDSSWIYSLTNKKSAFTCFVSDGSDLTIDDNGVSVVADPSATKANFYYSALYRIGRDYHINIKKTGVDVAGANFTTDEIKRFEVRINSGDAVQTGINGSYFDIVDSYGYTKTKKPESEAILVVQKDDTGHVVQCSMKIYKVWDGTAESI